MIREVEIIEIEHIEQFYMIADMFEEYGERVVNDIYKRLSEFGGDVIILQFAIPEEDGIDEFLALKPYGEFETSIRDDAGKWEEFVSYVKRVVRLTAKTM